MTLNSKSKIHPDGNLLSDGALEYIWDSAGRLAAVYAGTTRILSNAYDHAGRRIIKQTPDTTNTFIYDGWNPIIEIIAHASGAVSTNQYFWGIDLSGTPEAGPSGQGAGGVGGLVAVSLDGTLYFPLTDNNGNITEYIDTTGAIAAQYRYDAFGATQEESGAMSGAFPFKFSTKYFDVETGLYYYGYRFYSSDLRRWINRDPIEERGGINLYGFCGNDAVNKWDYLGMKVMVLFVESKKTAEAYKDITAEKLSTSFSNIDSFLLELEKVTTKWFNANTAVGNVYFNGEKFNGTKEEYISQVRREKESKFIKSTGAGFDAVLSKLTSFAAQNEKDYDETGLFVHSVQTPSSYSPTGDINFNGELITANVAIEKLRNAGKPQKGKLYIVTCFRTWDPNNPHANDAEHGNTYLRSTEESLDIENAEWRVLFRRKGNEDSGVITGCIGIQFTPAKIIRSINGADGAAESF